MPNATATTSAPAEIFSLARSSSDWLDASAVRALLKQNLGYTARQVSVSCRHSRQYLTITIRDASVDIARVEAFAGSLETWSMATDDVVTGQSFEVTTSSEVDKAHAAPFIDEAFDIALGLIEPGQFKTASNGAVVISQGFDIIVQRGTSRPHFAGSRDYAVRKDGHQLALAIARA